MLKDEQAAELLRRCEAIAGRPLAQARGNLRRAATRPAAVWELLVLEAAAELGPVQYESIEGGPDIRLLLPSERWLSIEVAYLHRRFVEDERRCRLADRWMNEAAAKRKILNVMVGCRVLLDPFKPTKLMLPSEADEDRFLASEEVQGFLSKVELAPGVVHELPIASYSLVLTASPRTNGAASSASAWRVLDSPQIVTEHAAFRALKGKIEQHNVGEPYIVCIGSDVSSAFDSGYAGFGIRLEQALTAALRQSQRVSGVLICDIKSRWLPFGDSSPVAQSRMYDVTPCRHPLTEDEKAHLRRLHLNKWKYTFPLSTKEAHPTKRHPRVRGPLKMSYTTRGTMKLQIPASILVDVLAGKSKLEAEYGGAVDPPVDFLRCLREGWSIVSCELLSGNIEQGLDSSVVLELAPPFQSAYWPTKTKQDNRHYG